MTLFNQWVVVIFFTGLSSSTQISATRGLVSTDLNCNMGQRSVFFPVYSFQTGPCRLYPSNPRRPDRGLRESLFLSNQICNKDRDLSGTLERFHKKAFCFLFLFHVDFMHTTLFAKNHKMLVLTRIFATKHASLH